MKENLLARNINVYYGSNKALHDVSLDFAPGRVTALIGPSGCGKSTFLRCLNRMNDLVPGARVEGEILLDGEDVNRPGTDVVSLRRRVGMVFQKPNPFPKSIFENVAYGLRVNGLSDETLIAEKVEISLRRAAIFDEVNDAPWPWSRRCCSWTNRPAPWIPSPPRKLRKASASSRLR